MWELFEPTADHYWQAVGWIEDKNGVKEIVPRTPAEWDAVRNAATTVAEAGNLLLMKERAVGRADWISYTQALIKAAIVARDAAIARDPKRVFDAGADLYDRCTDCHAQYLVPLYPLTMKPR
jgi:hypothetical protein